MKWGNLSVSQKDEWTSRAREIIYPDLRLGYDKHDMMLSVLGKALYDCHVLSQEGGGGHQKGTSYTKSAIE